MRHLIVLRHAKTERDHPDGDRHRQLTKRGERDAAAAAQAILHATDLPDLIVTSDAVRAVQTAEIVASSIGFERPIVHDSATYTADVATLLHVVQQLTDDASTVVLVGHNPGFLDLINWFLSSGEQRGHLPTAAFAVVSADAEHWSEISPDGSTVSPIVSP